MEEYLQSVIAPLLSEPTKLRITPKADEVGLLLTIDVAPEDMGFLIGKAGRTINSVRALMTVRGMKERTRVSVRINEPENKKADSPK